MGNISRIFGVLGDAYKRLQLQWFDKVNFIIQVV